MTENALSDTRPGPTIWNSAPMQARIRRRYVKERLFRAAGAAALVVAVGFLAFLLLTIIAGGWQSFQQTRVLTTVNLGAEKLGITAAELRQQPQILLRVDFESVVAAAMPDRAPANAQVLSDGAWLAVRDAVRDNPGLIGTSQRFWLVASSDIDQLSKGHFDPRTAVADGSVAPATLAAWQELRQQGRLKTSFNREFLTGSDSIDAELAGVQGALVGSLLTLFVTFIISFPVGVLAAIYLEEFAPRNRWTDVIEVSINNLAAVPSIIFGLLGLAVFLNVLHMPRSAAIVGGLTLALMTMPVIVIAGRAAIKSVPPSIRNAALGVGASPVQVVFHHVLPLALPGMLTGTILGLARALGEAAPLLLIGMRAFMTATPRSLTEPATALPVQIFIWSDNVGRGFVEKTNGAIIVLLVVLLSVNSLAIYLRNRFEVRW